jgi:uncharacterized protein (DUF433 family)
MSTLSLSEAQTSTSVDPPLPPLTVVAALRSGHFLGALLEAYPHLSPEEVDQAVGEAQRAVRQEQRLDRW